MSDHALVGEMASFLVCRRVDLGDERQVIRALTDGRYLSGDIIAFMDKAIDAARELLIEKRGVK